MDDRHGASAMRAALLCCTAVGALLSANAALAQGSAGGGSPSGSPTEQPSPPSSSQGTAAGPAGAQAGAPGSSNTTAAPSSAAAPNSAFQGTTLQEVVVTAQKRTQNLQDVPISVTAVTAQTLQAQRISNVNDLSSAAPNFTARQSGGGAGIPTFSSRGINSYGVVPGSDKEISIYIDGVYIGTSVGSVFDLPDIERIEVLHGPQGTLFGRNATAGAVSIITPDSPGKFGLHAEGSLGNYDERRVKLRLDTPTFSGFSGSISYVHDEADGDVKNTGAGTVWDRSAGGPDLRQPTIQVSPKYLGSKDEDEVFTSLRYHPFSALNVVYKFDYEQNHFTPEANAAVGTNFSYAPVAPAASFLNAILAANPVALDTSGKRPDSVNNSFTTPGYSSVFGHSLTATYRVNDSLSVKNIASYRSTFIFSNSQLDGFGGLTQPASVGALNAFIPVIAPTGSRVELFADSTESDENQWSDEPQINFDSKYLTLTLGALFFHENTENGGPPGLPNNYALTAFNTAPAPFTSVIPASGAIPAGQSISFNTETSTAGYVQAEVHVLPHLDVVGGYRTTTDHKTGSYYSYAYPALSFVYDKTKPSYLIGVNYKPIRDLLLYAKYSTAFVSGGAVGPVAFAPETAASYEGGFKGDFLHHRLSADLSVFSVRYNDIQSAQSGQNVGQPTIGTVIVDQGGEKARGFEFQGNAIPIRHLTLGLGTGYTDFHLTSVNPLLTADGALGPYYPTLEPKWTTNLSAQYETDPLFQDARLLVRSDAYWHSRERSNAYTSFDDIFPGIAHIPSTWNVSARIALEHIDLPYGRGEVALWGKNLTNDRSAAFPLSFFFQASTTFVQARTYGIDLIYDF